MEQLNYQPTDSFPGIILDKNSGKFQIFGKSFPEDAAGFYQPVFEWIDQYAKNPLKTTVIEFKMSYFNNASAKVFLMIMLKFIELSKSGNEVKIRWLYNEDEEDIEEAGEEYDEITDVNFVLIPIESQTKKTNGDDYFDNIMKKNTNFTVQN